MNKTYDRYRAKLLVPLLNSITTEISERMVAIAELESRYAALQETGSLEFFEVTARLATHRRYLRLAKKEIEGLGCQVDEGTHTRVFIPGADGGFDRGFRWEAGDENVSRVAANPAA